MLLDEYNKKNHFMTYNDIEPIHAGENDSEVRVELKKKGKNLGGYAHGGLLATLADCAAGMAARGDGRHYVTQSMNMDFISNVKEGEIYAIGKVVHRGKTITLVRVKIKDGIGKLLAEASVSMFCIGGQK